LFSGLSNFISPEVTVEIKPLDNGFIEEIKKIEANKIKEKVDNKIDVQEEPIIYPMNENVNVDELTYKVTKAETFTKMGSGFFEKETTGKFVKVYLEITNDGKETKQIFTPRFKIEDSKERSYDRLSDDMFYISNYLELGKQIQPGLATHGAIVFEMPNDSADLVLRINGDWLSASEIKISLSDIRNIGKDTTQEEEQNERMEEIMQESQEEVEELISQCNAPFKCSSDCAAFSDSGQKDCPSGQVCCLTEQSELDEQMDKLMEESKKQTEELLNQCNAPFACTSSCPDYYDLGQKNCPSGQLCCLQS